MDQETKINKVNGYVKHALGSLGKVVAIKNKRGRSHKAVIRIFQNKNGYPTNSEIAIKIDNGFWEPVSEAYVILFVDEKRHTPVKTLDISENPCSEITLSSWYETCITKR